MVRARAGSGWAGWQATFGKLPQPRAVTCRQRRVVGDGRQSPALVLCPGAAEGCGRGPQGPPAPGRGDCPSAAHRLSPSASPSAPASPAGSCSSHGAGDLRGSRTRGGSVGAAVGGRAAPVLHTSPDGWWGGGERLFAPGQPSHLTVNVN